MITLRKQCAPFTASLVALAAVSALCAGTVSAADNGGAADRVPVVVELFTSESCASCPPAEAVLANLSNNQPIDGVEIIALAEHITYWNHLDWKDRFSKRAFTERQRFYAMLLSGGKVYTPQMVVDGRAELIGSHRRDAEQAIRDAARRQKAEVRIAADTAAGATADSLALTVTISGHATALGDGNIGDVWLAVTESGLSTGVESGENRGRTLDHPVLARHMAKVGKLPADAEDGNTVQLSTELTLDDEWARDRLQIIAFLQRSGQRGILGAVSRPLTDLVRGDATQARSAFE